MKERFKHAIIIITILIIVFILENINYFRYPLYLSQYATSNIIFDYLKENGHLPTTNIGIHDFYQPIIVISFLLTYFIKLFDTLFSSAFLLSYSFPILIYLLTYKISDIFLIKDKKKIKYIALTNAIFASVSTFILDMSNDLLIFFFIFLLIYIHIKDGFRFSKFFYSIAILSSFIITLYYYTGMLIFTIFMFIFFLYFLIVEPKSKRLFSPFLFLSCINFWLIFLFYGIIGGTGFTATFQNYITKLFFLPTEWFFLYSSIITVLFHIMLQMKFQRIFYKIINFINKSIKYWIFTIIIFSITIIIFIGLNFESFLRSESLVLEGFNFPPAYYDPVIRIFNFINLFIIIIPYLLFSISIIKKLIFKCKLNQIDLLYLGLGFLIILFIPIYYIYGGLNMVLNRSLRMFIVVAMLFPGFFYLKTKAFFAYIINPNRVKVNIVLINKKDSHSHKIKYHISKIHFNIRFINKLIIYIIIQCILQVFLVLLLNKTEIVFNVFKILIINFNYFFFPGYILLEIFNLKTKNIIENYLFSAFVSFCFLILALLLLNFLSIFFINFLLLLPYIFFSLMFLSALLFQMISK